MKFFKIQPPMANLEKRQLRREMTKGVTRDEEFWIWANSGLSRHLLILKIKLFRAMQVVDILIGLSLRKQPFSLLLIPYLKQMHLNTNLPNLKNHYQLSVIITDMN
jgi:hypothetical protein